jgi:hypothetical protein
VFIGRVVAALNIAATCFTSYIPACQGAPDQLYQQKDLPCQSIMCDSFKMLAEDRFRLQNIDELCGLRLHQYVPLPQVSLNYVRIFGEL